jgi:FkbM family methyltransferase
MEADEHYVREVIIDQAYNPAGFEIDETDTVVDVGANIGAFSLWAAQRAREGRIVSIEPVASNFRLLCRNLAINRLRHVSPLRAAVVGTDDRTTTVYLSPHGSGHHSTVRQLAGDEPSGQCVEAVRLEGLFQTFAICFCDFLKLDCEGAEFEILQTLPPEVAARIGKMAIEYHTRSARAKRPQADALVDRIVSLGFEIHSYTDVQGTNRGLILARRPMPSTFV